MKAPNQLEGSPGVVKGVIQNHLDNGNRKTFDSDCGRANRNANRKRDFSKNEDRERKEGYPFCERIKIVATVPHLVSLVSLIILITYVSIAVRVENARQLRSEDLARRCAFVYLATSNHTDIDNLGFSLQSLNKYFKSDMKYNIVIVHEDIPPIVRGRLQSLSEVPIQFREFQLEGPSTLNLSNEVPTFTKRSTWGYQNMIRFWFYSAMLAEASESAPFTDLDYVVRLDSDSAFTGEISRDFIKDFIFSGAQYGYHQRIGKDCGENITYGLKELAKSYVELNGISPRSSRLWVSLINSTSGHCLPKFENHFEIINMRFFRSHAGIQDWIKVVDTNGGIFRHRWGDAVLRFITVALYAAPEKLIRYKQEAIPYRHPHQMGN